MGYRSIVKGNIEIKPTVPYRELKVLVGKGLAKGFSEKYYSGDRCAQVDYYSNEIETDNGLLTLTEGWSITAAYEDEMKAYTLIGDVQEIVDILGIEKYRYQGYLEVVGEGDGSGEPDIWRVRIKDGRVQQVVPKLVWPED